MAKENENNKDQSAPVKQVKEKVNELTIEEKYQMI